MLGIARNRDWDLRTGHRRIASYEPLVKKVHNLGFSTYLYLKPLVTPTIKLFYPSQSTCSSNNIDLKAFATYDDGSDSSEGSDALARTVVELDLDNVLLRLYNSSVHNLQSTIFRPNARA